MRGDRRVCLAIRLAKVGDGQVGAAVCTNGDNDLAHVRWAVGRVLGETIIGKAANGDRDRFCWRGEIGGATNKEVARVAVISRDLQTRFAVGTGLRKIFSVPHDDCAREWNTRVALY